MKRILEGEVKSIRTILRKPREEEAWRAIRSPLKDIGVHFVSHISPTDNCEKYEFDLHDVKVTNFQALVKILTSSPLKFELQPS